ncbi:sushi domain-containing protein 4 [Chanos chanos]|uniref:Sushi domain-containing protein 4 n=1 Tax=Chanos chanos TaxID=29144 RepID=A0A6J2WHL9_CHACN|nr:sushi domain-containing protein 4-like [Chanos chanos]
MSQHADRQGETSPRGSNTFCSLFCLMLVILLHKIVTASPDPTAVEQFCRDPGVPEHGRRTPVSGTFFEKAVARFSCLEGYRLKGPAKTVCTRFKNGSLDWMPSLRTVCLPEDCLPPYIEDADISNKTYRPGDSLIISCHEGFQIRYPDMDNMQSVCQDDGTWDNQPICQGCLRPLIPPHSYMNISETEFSVPVGTVVLYQCFPGYKLEGAALLECMYNLIWSHVPPRCLDVEVCPFPPMVEHGDYICHPQPCDRYIHGTVVEYYCDPGYALADDYKYITCQYGQWFPQIQIYCIREETIWPGSEDSVMNTWKAMTCTASSVLVALLLLIMVKVFHSKCRTGWSSSEQQEDSRGPNFLVVDGIPVPLPTYEEAVNSPNYQVPNMLPSESPGNTQHLDSQEPPSYPGHPESQNSAPLDTGEGETCESISELSECIQSTQPSSLNTSGPNNVSERTNVITSIEETASTSPSIDIADEIRLVEDGAEED